jgi:two-component system, NarL family, response regulator NreC
MAAHLHLTRRPSGPETVALGVPVRVLLADNHALMRRSLRVLLDGEPDIDVIAEADDLEAVERQLRALQPNVLIFGLNLPGRSGIEVVRRLRERAPATQIVVMTMEVNPVFAQCAFAAGALGFVAKDLADDELVPALRAAARAERFLSPRLAEAPGPLHSSPTMSPVSP